MPSWGKPKQPDDEETKKTYSEFYDNLVKMCDLFDTIPESEAFPIKGEVEVDGEKKQIDNTVRHKEFRTKLKSMCDDLSSSINKHCARFRRY
jgi:hypothetical protein